MPFFLLYIGGENRAGFVSVRAARGAGETGCDWRHELLALPMRVYVVYFFGRLESICGRLTRVSCAC